jgi:hypothetical protein
MSSTCFCLVKHSHGFCDFSPALVLTALPKKINVTFKHTLACTEQSVSLSQKQHFFPPNCYFFPESISADSTPPVIPQKYIKHIPRVPQCLSPRPNWDLPLSRKRVYPPRNLKGTHLPVGKWGGGSQFGRLEKKPSTLSSL